MDGMAKGDQEIYRTGPRTMFRPVKLTKILEVSRNWSNKPSNYPQGDVGGTQFLVRNPSSSRQTDSGTRASPSSSFSSTASSTSSRGVAKTIVVLVVLVLVARKKGKEREKERAQKSRILLFFL